MQDHEIITLCEERNEKALTEMQIKYGKYGVTIAYNILGNQEDAEECVNDAYLRLWGSIPPQRPQVLLAYWGKIVRNLALNQYKSYQTKKRNPGQVPLALHELEECIAPVTSFEEGASQSELTNAINRFLAMQTPENRVVFSKRYWYLYSIEQIATDLRMSESKVKSSLFRTRNKLKKYLLNEGIYI